MIAGPRQGPVRATGLLRAHPGMSVDEFVERWFEGHVLTHTLPTFTRLAALRCNVVVQDELGQAEFDGTQDLWWDSPEDMEADLNSSGRKDVSAHVREILEPIDLSLLQYDFIDDPGSDEPNLNAGKLRPQPTPGLKVIALLRATDLDTREELRQRLVEDHIPRLTARLDNVTGLRCAITQDRDLGGQEYDAIEELWWLSREGFEADVASPVGRAAHENMASFMDSTDLIVREYVFV